MFSMAGASLILPFLPMLPIQVLLNNFLYDLSEVPIPMDEVDDELLACAISTAPSTEIPTVDVVTMITHDIS